MAKDKLHVVPHDNNWAVKREGNERVSSTHATQKEAIDGARTLAKEGDDIVIHRPDGTIREVVTYTASSASNGNGQNGRSDREEWTEAPRADRADRPDVRPHDVASVGTRVSWSAILAGVVIALALYTTLNVLAAAIGLSAIDQMRTDTFAAVAAIVATVSLLVALFVGGFVASRATVGEERNEAMAYGVLVWATVLMLLVTTGASLGIGYFAGVREFGRPVTPATVEAPTTTDGPLAAANVSPQALAWWTFAGVVLSALASIAGAVVGAGPEVVLRRIRDARARLDQRVAAIPAPGQPVPEPQPASRS